MKLVTERFPKRGDKAAAARRLARWREHAPAALPAQAEGFLARVMGHSPFLARCAVAEADFVAGIFHHPAGESLAALLAEAQADLARCDDRDRLMAGLRRTRRRAALLAALADLGGAEELEFVTGALSRTADACLGFALSHLMRAGAARGWWQGEDGVFLLGLGKLGAHELNYSSDVDLMALFDPARLAGAEDPQRHTVRLVRDLVQLMEAPTGDGYAFRTDFRLRPDPGATPLAVAVPAAETYYTSLGQNWERAAMIKARAVAGDLAAGADFLSFLQPWIWRRNLDFAAIQDIHSIKRQIHAHKGHGSIKVAGHDVKLGRGGIREIEFFCQTQQLIFGGRDASLRAPATLDALAALAAAGHVSAASRDFLSGAYRELRRIEHRLQMVEDRQTHRLPEDEAGLDGFARFCGDADGASFTRRLTRLLEGVEAAYAELFEEAPSLSGPGNLVFTGAEDDPGTIATLTRLGYRNPGAIAASVRAWHHGRYRATRTARARELLTELVPALIAAFAGTAEPDQAFLRFDEFIAALPAGVQLFALLYQNPPVLALLARVMGDAPELARDLARNPELLEAVVAGGAQAQLPNPGQLAESLDAMLAQARHYEDALDLLRRWARDHRFLAGLHLLEGRMAPPQPGPFLTAVAEVALSRLLPLVMAEFATAHGGLPGGQYALAGFGKLGSRTMGFGSDLDLVAIYDPAGAEASDGPRPLPPAAWATRLTQRLVAGISAPTAAGKLYEVDLRLRPSGQSGPLAVSLDAFEAYQRDEAWSWEHMALTRARVVAGPPALAARIGFIRRDVLTRPRDAGKLRDEVADMRQRIRAEHGSDDPWNWKHRRGGLVDAEFICQYLMLAHGAAHPELLAENPADAYAMLGQKGVLPGSEARVLADAYGLMLTVQAYLRLTVGRKFDPAAAPAGLKAGLARLVLGGEGDFAAASARLEALAARVTAAYDRLLGPAATEPPP